jgi:xanthine dehydrogenase accessory factor
MTNPTENLIAEMGSLMAKGENFSVVTVVRTENATSAKAGAKAIVLEDGTIHGFLGGACVQRAVKQTAAAVLREGRPRLIRVKPDPDVTTAVDLDGTELHRSYCPSGGTVDMFVEPMRPPPRIVICGGSAVAVALADLALRLGYRVAAAALAEDIAGFAESAEKSVGFDLSGLKIVPEDWIVVSTQGKRDREALGAALVSGADYVAFVGSRRKAQVLSGKLREMGLAEDRLARLKAPAGLDIHGIEPAEIALSIIAEIVERRRRGLRRDALGGVPTSVAPTRASV